MSVDEDTLLNEAEGQETRGRRRQPLAGITSTVEGIKNDFRNRQAEDAELEAKRQTALDELVKAVVENHLAGQDPTSFQNFYKGISTNFKHRLVVPELLNGRDGGPAYKNSELFFAIFKDTVMEENLLRHKNGSTVSVKSNSITYNPSSAEFGIDDAFEMALLAAHNRDMLGKAVKLTGTPREQAMLKFALEQVNKVLAPEQRITLKPSKVELPLLDFGDITLKTYLHNMGAIPPEPSIQQAPAPDAPQTSARPQTDTPAPTAPLPLSSLAQPSAPPEPVPAPPPTPVTPLQSASPQADNVTPSVPAPPVHTDAPRPAQPKASPSDAGAEEVIQNGGDEDLIVSPDVARQVRGTFDRLEDALRDDAGNNKSNLNIDDALPATAFVPAPEAPDASNAESEASLPLSAAKADAVWNEVDFDADEVFHAQDGLPVVGDNDVLNDQLPSQGLIRLSDEEWDIHLQDRGSMLLAKGKCELRGIAGALLDYVNDPEKEHLLGKISGDIVMSYDDKIMPFIKKRQNDLCFVYTARIDLFENGTPPANVEYIFHEKRKQSLLHIVSITGEGYQEYYNGKFFDDNLNPVFTERKPEEWGPQEGIEVLQAKQYLELPATFDNDFESRPDEISLEEFESLHAFEHKTAEPPAGHQEEAIESEAQAADPAPVDAQPASDKTSLMSFFRGLVRQKTQKPDETQDAVDPDFIGPPAPPRTIVQDAPQPVETTTQEQAEQADKRQPPYVVRIIQERLSAAMKWRLFGTFGVVAGAGWLAAATISGPEAGASANVVTPDRTLRIDVLPTTSERANLASLNIAPLAIAPPAPRAPEALVAPLQPPTPQSSGPLQISYFYNMNADTDIVLGRRVTAIGNVNSRLTDMFPEFVRVWNECDLVDGHERGIRAVITSGTEGRHLAQTHRRGRALDFRADNADHPFNLRLTYTETTCIVGKLRGLGLVVQYEGNAGNEHIHARLPGGGRHTPEPVEREVTPDPVVAAVQTPPGNQTIIIIPETEPAAEQPVVIASEQAHPSPAL